MRVAEPLEPFLRWAGGKRWLWAYLEQILPATFNRYHEPFLGGGAIFFAMRPAVATLSDSNPWLVETYIAIRDDYLSVEATLKEHHSKHSDEYYYAIRASVFENPVERAAQLIYLNRTCWNALFRVNKRGVFNVPRGTKNIVLYPKDNFRSWSRALENKDIKVQDFRTALAEASDGDFIFADPPYVTPQNSFVKYNDLIFTWDDQIELAKLSREAASRGATVIISNASHEAVLQLYEHFSSSVSINRSSVLAASSKYRRSVSETIFCVYPEGAR